MKRRSFLKYLGFVAMGSLVPLTLAKPGKMLLKISFPGGKDMHFIETRKWQIGEIVKVYNVPPHILAAKTRAKN